MNLERTPDLCLNSSQQFFTFCHHFTNASTSFLHRQIHDSCAIKLEQTQLTSFVIPQGAKKGDSRFQPCRCPSLTSFVECRNQLYFQNNTSKALTVKMLEKGRLYSIRKDGSKDLVYLRIKRKRFLFGSSENSTVRIYIDGIFPKHCILTIGGQGKAYLKPLHPSALTLVNGIKIKHKICLEDNDVITIFSRQFQFAYPPNSLSNNVSIERFSYMPYSKQMQPAQKLEKLTFKKNCESSFPSKECETPNSTFTPKKLICMIEGEIFKKISEDLFCCEQLNISFANINAQQTNFSYPDTPLIKYKNPHVEESLETRKNLAFKLYEFFNFIRELLNRNEEYSFDLLPILELISKYGIARAREDILFLPFCSLYLNKHQITIQKKPLQSEIFLAAKNLSPDSETMLEIHNPRIGQKPNQQSNGKIPISYKKRSKTSNVNCTPKKLICMIEGKIFKKTCDDLFCHEQLNISFENINTFGCDKPLRKYKNPYVESLEARKNLAFKLYEFFNFITELLNRNEEYAFDLLPILELISKYSIARAKEDILFLPFCSLNKREIIIQKKPLQSGILLHAPKNLSPDSETMSEIHNPLIGKKQNQQSNRKNSVSYKKRVSLAVKRYHLRKRKSIMMAKYFEIGYEENLEPPVLKQESKEQSIDNVAEEQSSSVKTTEAKLTKRRYQRKKKEVSSDKTAKEDKMETPSICDSAKKLNKTPEPSDAKSKRGNCRKKTEAPLEKFGLYGDLDKENIPEPMQNSETMSEIHNPLIGKKQNQQSNRKNSVSYKKRVSLAVKRYHLRKRKSIMMAKYFEIGYEENLEPPGLNHQSEEQSIDYAIAEQLISEKLNETKPTKRYYKKKINVSTNENDEMKASYPCDSAKNQNTSESSGSKSKKGNCRKKKEVSVEKIEPGKSTQKSNTQEILLCQRVTRSMAKKHH